MITLAVKFLKPTNIRPSAEIRTQNFLDAVQTPRNTDYLGGSCV